VTTVDAAVPRELADGLFRIDTPLGARFASVYLLVGDDNVLLYDTGVDGTIPTHVLPALARLGVDPTRVGIVVISHADVDHFGGIADAREQFPRAIVVAGADDIPLINDFDTYLAERGRGFVDDFGWDEDSAVVAWCRSVTREAPVHAAAIDGDTIAIGAGRSAVIRAVPGHSRGHLAVDVPWADAVLVGDAVLARSVDLADGTPAFPPTYRYVDPYLRTIASLERLGRDLLLTAHYPVLQGGDAAGFLQASREFVERLDSLIVAELTDARHPLTLADLLDRLNPIAGVWPTEGTAGALAFPVVGHLERLRDRGRLASAGTRDGVPAWVLVEPEGVDA
jgi:glyoxylase-like metal-dependent hydrolase (beta-lactamase superfamily II)